MNKIFIFFLLSLHTSFLFGNDINLKKARQKFDSNTSITYTSTAHYPNPETEEVTSFSIFYILNNYKNKNFEFYSKAENVEEFYIDGNYSSVNSVEKVIYKYEGKENLTNSIQNSRLVQYGPTFLLKHNWKYEDEVLVYTKKHSHYSFIEKTYQYEGKTIKAEFHIYISPNYTITKFERKSYVENKLGQTITFEYSNYNFSKNKITIKSTIPKNYALKYFERNEISLLKKGIKAPTFKVKDINNNLFSSDSFVGNKTILIFSSTNCGASKEVFDYLNAEDFKLPSDFKFINIYASDKKEKVEKYFKSKSKNFPLIVDKKEIEIKYQISGYPVLYIVDENGIVAEIHEGNVQIIECLKSKRSK